MCFQLLQREHILEVGGEGIKLDITSLALMSHFMLDCINDLVGLSAVYEKKSINENKVMMAAVSLMFLW